MTKLKFIAAFAISIAVSACSNPYFMIDGNVQEYESAREVIENSSMPYTPISAGKLKFYSEKYLDRYEYLYFEDSKIEIDEFSKNLIGYVPDGLNPYFRWARGEGISWWPKYSPAATRSGFENSDNHGDRRILIVDGPSGSRVWVFASAHD